LDSFGVPTMTMGKSWTRTAVRSLDHDRGRGPDPHRLDLKTWVNDELRQNASTSDLIFDTDAIIEHLSTAFTSNPET